MSSLLEQIASHFAVTPAEVASWSPAQRLSAARTVENASRQTAPDALAARIEEGHATTRDRLAWANRQERVATAKAQIGALPAALRDAPAVKKLEWLHRQQAKARIQKQIDGLNDNHPMAQFERARLAEALEKLG